MVKLLKICLLITFGFSFLSGKENPPEFTLIFSSDQWDEIGDPADFDYDLVVLNSGVQLRGYVKSLPPIVYPFGQVEFDVSEVAAVAVDEDHLQYVTRNGQNFIGAPLKEPLVFWKAEIEEREPEKNRSRRQKKVREYCVKVNVASQDINFILLKRRGKSAPLINSRFMSVVLDSGDRFPIVVDTYELRVGDGWRHLSIQTADIAVLHHDGQRVYGYLKGEALDEPLKPVLLLEEELSVRLAKDGKALRIPWDQIKTLYGDMGRFIVSSPYRIEEMTLKDMAYIPPGRFFYGEKKGETNLLTKNNRGAIVETPAFYIDRTEVTNAAYERFVRATGHRAPPHWEGEKVPEGLENYPVVNVSYEDAASFAAWAGKSLPTELQWERAAKGATGGKYPYGDRYDASRAVVEATAPKAVPALDAVEAVNRVFDMSGNVAEWTCSHYEEHNDNYRTVRGGSFASSEATSTTTYRVPMLKEAFNERVGFRCVTLETR